MKPIVRAEQLSKSFGRFKAVDHLSFSILPGEVYGFLGQNGAGKSTTMRMLLGLITPDTGSVFIKGEKLHKHRRELLRYIGAIIERPDMYGYLSGWDNLRMFASLSGKVSDSRLYEVFELVGLKGREKDKVKTYSQGMKQRLGIAVALAHDPDLLILDEPVNGLDPQGIMEMRYLIRSLSTDYGKTIMVSSHLLYEIEQIATRMLIIHKGKKVVEGKVEELLDPKETLFDIHVKDAAGIVSSLPHTAWQSFFMKETKDVLQFKMHPDHMPALNRWLVQNDAQIYSIESGHSLEAYFLSLTHDTTHTTGGI